MIRSFGYIMAPLSDSDLIKPNILTPNEYIIKGLSQIHDQGSTPKCVSVCLTDMINYRFRYLHRKNIKKDSYFFDNRIDKSQNGLIPKLAFQFAKSEKCKSDLGYSISYYARLSSIPHIKSAIIAYGPVMACFIAKSEENEFWKGNHNYGGHAVLLVGFNQDGFILRNSWGKSYGDNGYYTIKYNDCKYIIESWCLIN